MARGTARPDSDLDLLIIEESELPRYQRASKYRRALIGIYPSKDIVVWTPEEVYGWRSVCRVTPHVDKTVRTIAAYQQRIACSLR